MFNQERLAQILVLYKKRFPDRWAGGESFKWKAIRTFQNSWNLDVDAAELPEMLEMSLAGADSMLNSSNVYPLERIVAFSKIVPEEVRSMFVALFDETRDIYERIAEFKTRAATIQNQYDPKHKNHYQAENAISVYLWLRYPDKYYIYKISEVKAAAEELGYKHPFKNGAYEDNVRNFFEFYDEICSELQKDTELINILKSRLTDECYPDTQLRTVTFDLGFYISRELKDDEAGQRMPGEIRYWWLNANPKNWDITGTAVGDVRYYTLLSESGHKRRIYRNFLDARADDIVIGYASTPVKGITAIAKIQDEQHDGKLYFEKTEALANPVSYNQFSNVPELQNMGFLKSKEGSLYSLTEEEYGVLMKLIREKNPVKESAESTASSHSNDVVKEYSRYDFLDDVYMPADRYNSLVAVVRNKKNVILQGAPGVGKTYTARRLAWSMMGVRDNSRIELVQFHQSYSYEDFVMGYKPTENGFQLTNGVFYDFCQKAAADADREYFFIIDEINRGNLSKIFGELLMMIENDYRGETVRLAYDQAEAKPFYVPKNLYIIGMMNTADRSLALIDYALRRRFSFFDMVPGFKTDGFKHYKESLGNNTFDELIDQIIALNDVIADDDSLGDGFQIGHSYFCGRKKEDCTTEWMKSVVDYDILPMLREYWFDDKKTVETWTKKLNKVFDD